MRGPLDLREVDAFLDHHVERGELAEVPYDVDELVGDVVNLGLGVEAAETEADGAMCDVVAQAEGLEHEAGLQRGGGTGRPGGNRNIVDAHQQALALDVDEAHVQVAGQVMLHVAVDLGVVERGLQLLAQIVAELDLALALGRHLLAAELARLAETDDAWNIQRARAHTALMAATVLLLGDLHARVAAANVERTDALRPVDLVA